MVLSLTYRTAGAWGAGQGSDLTAAQVDTNFYNIYEAISAIESAIPESAGIDYINQPAGGNQFFFHLTNHVVLGPFTIPTSQWNPRGAWVPNIPYAPYDVFSENGSLYLVMIASTSAATFSASATDGLGHNLYYLILQQVGNMIPDGGVPGQRLVMASSPYVTAWESDLIRLPLYVEGQPQPGELLFQYVVTDYLTLPAGLPNSAAYQGVPTQTDVSYTLNQNGNPIGSINFTGPSPDTITFAFGATVNLVPGDVLSLVGPGAPDAVQANISFSILATLA